MRIKKAGKELLKTFADEVLVNRKTEFHESIKRQQPVLFQSSLKNTTIKRNNVSKTIDINWNILGKLIALSAKNNKAIDYENALKHPLCPIPLSIESADDSQRKTTKNKLMEEM